MAKTDEKKKTQARPPLPVGTGEQKITSSYKQADTAGVEDPTLTQDERDAIRAKIDGKAKAEPKEDAPAREAEVEAEVEAEAEPEFTCDECGESFGSAQALGGHSRAHKSEDE